MFDAIHAQSTAYDQDGNDDLEQLLHPGSHFTSPMEVVNDKSLGLAEKRAILSSWASDACAVEAMPTLRKVPGAASPISFDDILDALQLLDREWRGRTLRKSTKLQGNRAGGGGVHFG
jgi:hypothetical protein